ncbi:MAG: thioredoxin family protein [Sediminibacterium sp.]|nr:thioredoxin family protein [Sediminibacterium sp.]MDP3127332.1 thioredoxin family protein [Sediminibacterium sp.]
MRKMHKKILLSGLLVMVAVLAFTIIPKNNNGETGAKIDNVKGNGIQFIEANWNKALEEAKKQNKLIFLDAYATWCGPCKLLKKKTFPNKEAGELFNQNFINVAIDMEKGDGPTLSDLYKVDAYPTLIITDADGNIITYTKGYMQPKQLIEFGKYGLSQKKKYKPFN